MYLFLVYFSFYFNLRTMGKDFGFHSLFFNLEKSCFLSIIYSFFAFAVCGKFTIFILVFVFANKIIGVVGKIF